MAGMLYLVPTPIGNLGDISVRCRETLEQADFIAAEDTRVTLKLLNHMGIKKSLVSYFEHNKAAKGNVKPAHWYLMPAAPPFPTPVKIWYGNAPKRALPFAPFPAPAP